MKFDRFWNLLHVELQKPKDFTTLAQQKKFNARSEYNRNGEQVIRIIPDSGIERGAIAGYEFEGIWDNAKGYSNETRFINKGGRLDLYSRKKGGMGRSNNISYITRLIYEIVQEQKME